VADVRLDRPEKQLPRRQPAIQPGESGDDAVDQRLDPRAVPGVMPQGVQCGLDGAAAVVPITTNSSVFRWVPAYCRLPAISWERTFPATRTMNSSPKPASKISSGGTRESLQHRIVA